MRIANSTAIVFMILIVGGATVRAQIAPAAAGVSALPNPVEVAPDYVIGAGDVLKISVWQEPQFGETVEVRPDGRISLPLVSDVAVAGLTPVQAQRKLTDRLEQFVKRPRVTVVVSEVHSKVVYVIGEVGRPGSYPLTGEINVEQVIALAGGATSKAKKKHVYVLRSGLSNKLPVNYQKVLEGKNVDQNLVLMPGDTVVVP
jgi:polysaccharide biosynthesis/export protein